ncbi:MAG: tonB protein [Pseudobdellovibrio sp.]|nr:tonB protein [Pseudobdellovibrio sp.]
MEDLRNKPVELEVLKSDSTLQERLNETRQLVKQLKTTVEQLKDVKDRARFESEQTQRVVKETRASVLGKSQNENSAPQPKMQILPQTKISPEVANRLKLAKNDGDLPEFARMKSPAQQVAVSEQSAISHALPSDIQASNSTNLNTDANTYYSFYSRVEELFYVRWVERANYYWNRISHDYKRTVLSGKTWTTDLEVWLTSTGEYHSAYIKRSSGYQPFDEAAVYAFKNARLFPNPPKAKVEADGFVRLRYRFNINVAAYQ